MPEKCQIIPKTVFASCETYNCLKPVAYAIGRPDGPPQKLVYFCDQCMRDIVSSIPLVLLPEPEQSEEQEIDLDQLPFESDEEAKDKMPAEPVPPRKVYYCKHCGEAFDTPAKVGSHSRYCKARN